MPNGIDGQNQGGNPSNQPLASAPNIPLPKQDTIANPSISNHNQETETTKELAQDVHWITHATFWSQIGLAIIGIGALLIYHGQLSTMNQTVSEMQNQTTILRESL